LAAEIAKKAMFLRFIANWPSAMTSPMEERRFGTLGPPQDDPVSLAVCKRRVSVARAPAGPWAAAGTVCDAVGGEGSPCLHHLLARDSSALFGVFDGG